MGKWSDHFFPGSRFPPSCAKPVHPPQCYGGRRRQDGMTLMQFFISPSPGGEGAGGEVAGDKIKHHHLHWRISPAPSLPGFAGHGTFAIISLKRSLPHLFSSPQKNRGGDPAGPSPLLYRRTAVRHLFCSCQATFAASTTCGTSATTTASCLLPCRPPMLRITRAALYWP